MIDFEWMNRAWAQVWQLAALIVVVAVVARIFGRKRPHLAYVLWLVVLAKCLTPPVITSSAGIFCRLQSLVEAVLPNDSPSDGMQDAESPNWDRDQLAEVQVGAVLDGPAWDDSTEGRHLEGGVIASASGVEWSGGEERVDDPFYGLKTKYADARSFAWLGVVWLTGTLIVILAAAWRTFACLRRLGREGVDSRPELQELLDDLRRRLRIGQQVRLLVTRSPIGPAVVGLTRPTIVLPSIVATGRSAREMEAILAHELIHIRRGDLWTGLVQVLAQGVWWFHPLVWFANRRATRVAESCCDQETIAALACDPFAYAESLLDVVAIRNKLVPVPAFPGVRPVDVTRERLERIMQTGQGSPKRTPWWCWMAMVIVGAATLPGAAIVAGASSDAVSEDKQGSQGAGTTNATPIPDEKSPIEPIAISGKVSSEKNGTTLEAIDSSITRSLGSAFAARLGDPNVLIKFPTRLHEKAILTNRPLLISADYIDTKGPIDSSVQLRGDVRLCLESYVATAGYAEITRKPEALTSGELRKDEELTIRLFGGVRWASPGCRIHTDQLIATLRADPEKPESEMVLWHLAATGRLPQGGVDPKGVPQGVPGTFVQIFPAAFSDYPFKPDGRVLNLSATGLYLRRNARQAGVADDSQELRLVGNVKFQLSNLRFQAREARLAFSNNFQKVDGDRESLTPISIALDREVEIEAIKFGRPWTKEHGTFQAEAGKAALTPILVRTKDRISMRCLGLSLSENVRFVSPNGELQGNSLQMDLPPIDIGTGANELTQPYPLPCQIEVSGNAWLRSRTGEYEEQTARADSIRFNLRKTSKTIDRAASLGESPAVKDDKAADDSTIATANDPESDKSTPVPDGADRAKEHVKRTARPQPEDPARKVSLASRALDRRLSLHFKEQPLGEVSSNLMKLLKVSIAFRPEALQEAGVSLNTQISIDVDGVPAPEAIRQILEPLKLVAIDGGEVLVITSRAAFVRQAELLTTTYPVADLVVPVQNLRLTVTTEGSNEVAIRKSKQVPEFSQLIELVESTIKPESWDNAGGPGSIREFHTTLSLVIRQTPQVHDEVAELLGKLRALRDLQVTFEMSAIRVPAGFRPELQFPIEKDDIRGALIDAEKVTALRKAIEENSDAKLYALPRTNLMHGQGLEINIPQFGRFAPPFQLVAAIAPHRECVAFSFAFGARDPIEAMARTSSFVIQADNSLLVDVTDELKTNSVAGLRPGEIAAIRRSIKKDSGERCLLLITPRFPPPEKGELRSDVKSP